MDATFLRLYHKIYGVSTTVTKFETQHKWRDGGRKEAKKVEDEKMNVKSMTVERNLNMASM
jgi:hypothetical protein